jgi:hypothetical protein
MYEMLKLDFIEETMCRTQTFNWFLKFTCGVTSLDDAKLLGCLSIGKTNKNVKIKKFVHEDGCHYQ